MNTETLNKPKIFKRGGKWQLCHLLLPAKTFSIELASAAAKYCQRMNSIESFKRQQVVHDDIAAQSRKTISAVEGIKFGRNRGNIYFSRDDAEQLHDLLKAVDGLDLYHSGLRLDYDRIKIICDRLVNEYKIPADCESDSIVGGAMLDINGDFRRKAK